MGPVGYYSGQLVPGFSVLPRQKVAMSWAVSGTRSPLTEMDREFIANVLVRFDINRNRMEPGHHGDARGVDRYVAELAREWGVEMFPHPADWEHYGKAAGPIRNREMLDLASPDILFAFPRRGLPNRGTLDCVKAAHERSLDYLVVWLPS